MTTKNTAFRVTIVTPSGQHIESTQLVRRDNKATSSIFWNTHNLRLGVYGEQELKHRLKGLSVAVSDVVYKESHSMKRLFSSSTSDMVGRVFGIPSGVCDAIEYLLIERLSIAFGKPIMDMDEPTEETPQGKDNSPGDWLADDNFLCRRCGGHGRAASRRPDAIGFSIVSYPSENRSRMCITLPQMVAGKMRWEKGTTIGAAISPDGKQVALKKMPTGYALTTSGSNTKKDLRIQVLLDDRREIVPLKYTKEWADVDGMIIADIPDGFNL